MATWTRLTGYRLEAQREVALKDEVSVLLAERAWTKEAFPAATEVQALSATQV